MNYLTYTAPSHIHWSPALLYMFSRLADEVRKAGYQMHGPGVLPTLADVLATCLYVLRSEGRKVDAIKLLRSYVVRPEKAWFFPLSPNQISGLDQEVYNMFANMNQNTPELKPMGLKMAKDLLEQMDYAAANYSEK